MVIWIARCIRRRPRHSVLRCQVPLPEAHTTITSWSINTVWRDPNVHMRLILAALLGFFLADVCFGQELNPPQQATAGNPLSIPTSGSGSATFYLFGPGSVVKQDVHLGQAVDVRGEDVTAA